MNERNDIDKLFKEGLEHPDIPFNEADWQSLEERMHPKEKRKIIPVVWFSAIGGIAALLLIVFLFQKPKNQNVNPSGRLTKENKQHSNKPTTHPKQIEDTADKTNHSIQNENFVVKEPLKGKTQQEIYKNAGQPINAQLGVLSENNQLAQLSNAQSLNLTNDHIFNLNLSRTVQKNPASTKTPTEKHNPEVILKKKTRFVLSISAAPDLTSVQTSGRSNLSGGIGAELTVFFTKKLSVTTGAAYAKKIYDSDFNLYNPNSNYVFKQQPSNIHANCDVIDIPLNVNYKVFENKRNSITVSTGLSSYLMLKEKYSYSYNADNGYNSGPKSYEVRNQNQHYFGVANIGVEFQHKINDKISIGAKPFVKLPLTEIGYGNSKLSSTGLSVSVNMNLFKK
ncbi:hypothetical protein [Pedobacter punctiformis]|uniref:Outer membrane protein beta-barrel domain-containing protein n=1 Tax=Pedobacter punctiformis TaxID=3004097 RepID=A0ABT4LDR6_9SPHI|nr:hypothetical protein [Pedobacter sp. HCMS5-2]MCZ4245867.1 hypothetical protein [Pedobacter sp. HCMS5-2]